MHQDLGAGGERVSPVAIIIAFAVAAFVSACTPDTSHRMHIAPSAEVHAEQIMEAADALNKRLGAPVFSVATVDSEHQIDGQAIIRVMRDGKGCPATMRACTHLTDDGVVIYLPPEHISARDIAHEMGHSAGLEHVPDRANLMFHTTDGTGWQLEDWQMDDMR